MNVEDIELFETLCLRRDESDSVMNPYLNLAGNEFTDIELT